MRATTCAGLLPAGSFSLGVPMTPVASMVSGPQAIRDDRGAPGLRSSGLGVPDDEPAHLQQDWQLTRDVQ